MPPYEVLTAGDTGLVVEFGDGVDRQLSAFVLALARRLWHLPVCYDCELAPDLGYVATRTGLTCATVVERHAAVAYHVYMLGFLPEPAGIRVRGTSRRGKASSAGTSPR